MGRGFLAKRAVPVGLALGLLCAVAPAPANAKKSPAKKAKVFERKGKKAYAKQRWDEAVVAFELAYKADPQPKYLYNVVKSLQRKGDNVAALGAMQAYLQEETDEGERADAEAEAAMIEAQLAKTHGRLIVDVTPDDAVMTLATDGGDSLEIKSMEAAWVKAGAWTLTAKEEGYEQATRPVTIKAGKVAELDVELVSKTAPPPEPAPEPTPEPAPEPPPEPDKPEASKPVAAEPPPGEGAGGAWVWTGIGLAAAGVATAMVFGALSTGAEQDRDDKKDEMRTSGRNLRDDIEALDEEARQHALLANVGWGVAVLGAGVGGWFLLTGDTAAAGVGGTW